MKDEIQYRAESVTDWRRWLTENHQLADHCWLMIAKKSSHISSVTLTEAIEEALCFGWIDSRKRGLDENFYLMYFTPRKNTKTYSKANQILIKRLIKQKRMTPSGLDKIPSEIYSE